MIKIGPSENHKMLIEVLFNTFDVAASCEDMTSAEALSCFETAYVQALATFSNPRQMIQATRDLFNSDTFEISINFYRKQFYGRDGAN